ncbi:putative cupredoxin [Medicago truncatula]|uniref:Cupredoxin superfamily protein, putative n=1 Tax=Medicago truncatula TaxID=3880 RepID=G7IBY5_MEDTR|nr:early nodulin-20-like [Medicago truncatula]AES62339.1 cupredoxin superfamily protein, putative [Medicago truncatula]RHN81678.1 putative cupredoxin [Medicago truncatula]
MSLPIFFYFLILSLFFKLSHSTTILVDGSSEWKNPTVSIGDSITFKHKQNYNLYIFKNQKAFNLCNFTQANLLTDPSTTSCSYTWHPSRVGFFYFTFSNDSLKACQDSQKLAIKVTPTKASAPEASSPMPTTPGPSSGGDIQSSPSFPWPFHPHQGSSPGPAPTPEASSPITVPLVPYKGSGDGMPFINSNPAVPLPTGEVDSATIHPLATSGHQGQVMIGLVGFHAAVHIMALLLL